MTTAKTAGRTSNEDRNNRRAVASSRLIANRIEAFNIGTVAAKTATLPTNAGTNPGETKHSPTPHPITASEPTIL